MQRTANRQISLEFPGNGTSVEQGSVNELRIVRPLDEQVAIGRHGDGRVVTDIMIPCVPDYSSAASVIDVMSGRFCLDHVGSFQFSDIFRHLVDV